MTRREWALICLALTVTGMVIYLSLDPDPMHRRMAYYYTMYNGAQRLAAYFGQWGLTAEIEYRRLLELERTI